MAVTLEEIQLLMKDKIAEELCVEPSTIEDDVDFYSMGLDSISSMYMLNEIEFMYNLELQPPQLIDYPTVATFSNMVLKLIHESK